MDLSQRHPCYLKTAPDRTASRDLYQGTRAVRAKGETYLQKHKNEDADHYAIRLNRAVLEPFVEKIVGSRQSLLFAKDHARTLPKAIEAYLTDVDRRGEPAAEFFRKAALEAQIDGIHWVAVDMTRLPAEGGFVSRLAEERAGHRPFFEHVPGAAVIDWEVGPDKRLLWAVVETQKAQDRSEPGEARTSATQWKVWTRDYWAAYEAAGESRASDKASYTRVDEGPNPTGRVPLVPFYGVRDQDHDFCGWPVARTVLDHIILRYNKASDLDWSEMLASHPIPYIVSPKKPVKLDVNKGIWIESAPNGGDIDIGYLEPSNGGLDGLRQSIRDIDAKIYAIALAQALKDTAQVQSAEGQREDRKIFSAGLKSASMSYEESEAECWELMLAWLGNAAAADSEVSIAYSRDFDDKMIADTMINAMIGLADGAYITKRTLLTILKEGEIIPESIDIEEELQALESANAKAVTETVRELRLVNGGGQAA